MAEPVQKSTSPDLSVFMNYEYDFDLDANNAAANVIRIVGKNKRVLEVGAGSGAISRKLVEAMGCEVVALEINPASVEKLKTFCSKVYSVDLNSKDWPSELGSEEKFGAVIAADVLEHLYDPWTVLKQMKTLLNDDGFIVLSLPHAAYWGVLASLAHDDFAYGEWGLFDKTHIRFFGMHNVQTLHESAGLAIEDYRLIELSPDKTEFSNRWDSLSAAERRAFASHRFSSVYQVVTKAVPVERARMTLSLTDTKPKLAAKPDNSQVRLIAFFLPQFHPIPENDEWWGKGFTEWTNVTKATPRFPGHMQPVLPADLGFYDLRLRQSRRDQIDLAKAYGIDGFCYHYYWFSGHRLLNAPLDDMLADPESDMPFCLCWANENWTRRWDAAEHEILIAQHYRPEDDLDFIKSVEPFLRDKRYIHVDGAPMLIVYRPQHLPDAKRTAAIWRDYCASVGIAKIHIACAFTHGNWDYRQFGFDSGVEFPPHNMTMPNLAPEINFYDPHSGNIFDCADVAERYLSMRYSPDFNGFRCVFPAWDNTARTGERATIGLNGTPRNYEFWLSQAVAKTCEDFPGQDRLVFINAWNEWAEGCRLEPCRQYGRQYLEATARAKRGDSPLTEFMDRGVPDIARIPRDIDHLPAYIAVKSPKKYTPLGRLVRKTVTNPLRAGLRRLRGKVPR
jgi:SAM-dependent methyltransferase